MQFERLKSQIGNIKIAIKITLSGLDFAVHRAKNLFISREFEFVDDLKTNYSRQSYAAD